MDNFLMWVVRNEWPIRIVFGIIAAFAVVMFVQFIAEHGRLPMGNGELWNWVFGWGKNG